MHVGRDMSLNTIVMMRNGWISTREGGKYKDENWIDEWMNDGVTKRKSEGGKPNIKRQIDKCRRNIHVNMHIYTYIYIDHIC